MDVENLEKVKIILLGDSGTGKTSLINIYEGKNFTEETTTTIGFQYIRDEMEFNNKKYQIHIWDTAGQEKFRSVSKIYFKGADIIIFVYDISKKESFQSLVNFWVDYVKSLTNEEAVFGLLGNKIDLFEDIQVSKEEGEQFAKNINAIFDETSAKVDKTGFKEFIIKIINVYISKNIQKKDYEKNFQINSRKYKKKTKTSGCCKN